MMEGISGEAASLAGHLKLSNLCWIYDNNHITIEGNTALAFSEDVATRFIGYGWNVTRVGDANDLEMLERAFKTFKNTTDRPTLIIVDSHIAYGAPNKQDTSAAHGEPLGEEEIRLTKRNYGWPEDAQVPRARRRARAFPGGHRRARPGAARRLVDASSKRTDSSIPSSPIMAIACCAASCRTAGTASLPVFPADAKGIATRDASGQVLNALARERAVADRRLGRPRPFVQDAADFRGCRRFQRRESRRTQYPLRHPRARHGRDPQWLVAVEDSAIWLRIPDLQRLRPRRDPLERVDGNSGHPHLHARFDRRRRRRADAPAGRASGLAARHSRLDRPATGRCQRGGRSVAGDHAVAPRAGRADPDAAGAARLWTARNMRSAEGVQRGAYVLADADDGKPEVLLLATGSEVSLCLDAYEKLKAEGIKARVVSMPSWEMFEHYCREHPEYREQVLPRFGHRARLGGTRLDPGLGALCRTQAATASAWTPSARRRRSRNCRRNSALPPRTSLQRPRSRSRRRGKTIRGGFGQARE